MSWQTVRLEPWDARNQATELMGALDGWHLLVMQVDATHTRHYLDGRLIATHGGRTCPWRPWRPASTLVLDRGLLPSGAEARTYVQDIDWVLHRPQVSLSPAEVVAEVTRFD